MVICVATEFTGNIIHAWMEKIDMINGLGEDFVKGLLLHWLDTASYYKNGTVVSMDILLGASLMLTMESNYKRVFMGWVEWME